VTATDRALTFIVSVLLAAGAADRGRTELLQSSGALPAHIAGAFRQPLAYQQTDTGQSFVFDRRAHAVYTIVGDTARKVIEVGAEPGRIIDPTAFALDPSDGTFVIADAPLRRQRIQVFTANGSRMAGFTLQTKEVARVTIDTMVLSGVGAIQFTGRSLVLNQPETGALFTELSLYGEPIRAFGELRKTGQEADRDLHFALNSGFPLIDPTGGFYFVFSAGTPAFRKYDAKGTLQFERHIEGPELDEYVRTLPGVWPKRRNGEGDLLPYVPPAIRAAGVDRMGRLWVSLMEPVTYVYDRTGDKSRTVQFKGAGVIAPSSFFFTKDGRVLVTPGCYEFTVGQSG
jgi:hypothetical protein